MITEAPTADWRGLYERLPAAIEQLHSHDANCSREAATLLECALFVLHSHNPVRAYDGIVGAIAELSEMARRHNLPCDTHRFMEIVRDDHAEWSQPRGEEEVIAELSGPQPVPDAPAN